MARIVFIGGSGRSGSTLVDRVIGQLAGFVSTGEVRDVWRAGLGENRLCGCGEPFESCPFWRRVGDEAFGGWSEIDRDAAERAVAAWTYGDAARRLMTGRRPAAEMPAVDLLRRLYAGISTAADGATIIDSSKSPPYGVLLEGIPGSDLRAVHLVRDIRGVAYSWSKEVTRPDTPGRTVHMPRLGASAVAARWLAHNTMMELLGRRAPVSRLRYEAFLADPRPELSRVLGQIGLAIDARALDFISDGAVTLRANHTVMGNPMRMATGSVPLRLDDAWRTNLPAGPRRLVTALTGPMLVRYGYPLRAARR